MLHGFVRDYSARTIVQIQIDTVQFPVELVIDTGFEGELALPANIAARFFPAGTKDYRTVMLADGRMQSVPVGYIDIIWHEKIVMVEVLITQGNPLLGMMLLQGSLVTIEAIDGGEVTIESID